MADEPIVKLVFLRQQAAQAGSRKAVVPLVEGADFDQFLSRVRRRCQHGSKLACASE